MKRLDYFKLALKHECYLYKDWVTDTFAVSVSGGVVEYPLQIVRDEKQVGFMFEGELVILDDVAVAEPVLTFQEPITLGPEELVSIKEPLTTIVGIAFINALVLVYPFGKKIPFINGEIKATALEKIIERRLIDVESTKVEAKEDVNENSPIYVDEYKKFVDSMLSLVGFTQLCTPSATERSLGTDPRIPALRARLLEENKDHLDDPAVIADIENALVTMDKAWLAGDESEKFYIKDKYYFIVRKKMYLMHGIERGFKDGGDFELIPNSLDEGWDISKMPDMVNSQREGTFLRGDQTALGGEAAKFLGRVFQNAVISEEDCGTKLGWPKTIDQYNKMDYIGLYQIINGKSKVITEEEIDSLVGKTIEVRSPMFCLTGGSSYCAHCMGDKIAASPNALTTHAISVGSRIMLAMMASMHGKKLEMAEYDFTTIH